MASADLTSDGADVPASGTAFDRLELWAEAVSDWINPILVKEVRQALKSWTFLATFLLLLLGSWLFSILGVLVAGASIQFGRTGMTFYYGYIGLLSFAAYIVVPFLAYRSLLSERDQSTFEVLSITTLRPNQIIWGKLLTAVVQLFVYFSALTPFIAFTYLLGGIDIISIMVSLVWTTLAAIGLSMITLTNSTLFQGKGWQSLQTLAVLGGLLFAFSMLLGMGVAGASAGGVMFNDWEFWVATFAGLTFYVAYFVLLKNVATAQLTFEADNRSTGIRVALVGVGLLALAWLAGVFLWEIYVTSRVTVARDLDDMGLALTWATIIHATAFGLFFVTEPDTLSRRVARGIPRNSLVRLLAVPFFPGGARGLLLVLILLVVPFAATIVLTMFAYSPNSEATLSALAAGCLYSILYLSLACWIARRGLRSVRGFTPAHARVVTLVLAALGATIPALYEAVVTTMFGGLMEWNLILHITNPFVVIFRMADSSQSAPLALLMLALITLLLLVLNLGAMFGGMAEILRGPAVAGRSANEGDVEGADPFATVATGSA
jgi:hypothetical protein